MKKTRLILTTLVLAFLFLSGCATTYKVDHDLADNFMEKELNLDKTGLYVIRGKNFYGGARSVWVAINDEIVASLPNSSHVYLELNSELNTLHYVQALVGFSYSTIDNRAGETIYIITDYATGESKELEPELGKTIVMKTKEVQPLNKPRRNDAYDNLVINPSLTGYNFMKEGGEQFTPDASHAVVTFYRPDELIKDTPFDIWNQDGYIGSTKGGQYFSGSSHLRV